MPDCGMVLLGVVNALNRIAVRLTRSGYRRQAA
jgi:hypothetical protein